MCLLIEVTFPVESIQSDTVCVRYLSVPEVDNANAFWFSRTGLCDRVFFTGPGLQSALFQHFKGMFSFCMFSYLHELGALSPFACPRLPGILM